MRIDRRILSPQARARVSEELAAAIAAKSVAGRICGDHCSHVCSSCGAVSCQCSCSPFCPQAASALSSDPAHPVEPAIAPLVFEMKRFRWFAPCWSCEGHADAKGAVWRAPTVWFYAEAQLHVRLLATGLARLAHAGRLSTPWRIVVTHSDAENLETTYALEPALAGSEGPDLSSLQRDVYEISRSLREIMETAGAELSLSLDMR
jgi:hypothetical protein